ncbi:MAG: hypothetical protein H6557_19405 [Lewinellaceae bacterium]|nr:hypothetical protein [Phaeodactylibacter sp.]MCB9038786.1 hypothetical protein [Lewinellaceae bacterium]
MANVRQVALPGNTPGKWGVKKCCAALVPERAQDEKNAPGNNVRRIFFFRKFSSKKESGILKPCPATLIAQPQLGSHQPSHTRIQKFSHNFLFFASFNPKKN